MKRISPSVRMKEEVTALFRGEPPAGDGVFRARSGGVRDLFALSGCASSPDSHDQSARAADRRRPAAYKSDPTLSYRALVSSAALCQLGHGVETLERCEEWIKWDRKQK